MKNIVIAVFAALSILVCIIGCEQKEKKMVNSQSTDSASTVAAPAVPPLEIIDASKCWTYQLPGGPGCTPVVSFSVKNNTTNRINFIEFRAVWIKDGTQELCKASKTVSDIESGIISQTINVYPGNKFRTMSTDMEEEIRQVDANVTLKLYYVINGKEYSIYNGPFNGNLRPSPL